jgi:hypothetical protein
MLSTAGSESTAEILHQGSLAKSAPMKSFRRPHRVC